MSAKGRREIITEAWCYELLRRLRWPEKITCPYCEQTRVTTHAKSKNGKLTNRYFCFSCRRTFTDLTGTPFARTHLPLGLWFLSLDLIGEGTTTSDLARRLGVKWDTTLYIQRRIHGALRQSVLLQRLRRAMTGNDNE